MIRLRANLDTAVERLLVLLMTAMVLCVLWQIVTRYLLGAASGWTGEAARFLMIWIGVLGGAYAVGQKIHLAMDLVKPKAGARQRGFKPGRSSWRLWSSLSWHS